jgi:hypothetical protein
MTLTRFGIPPGRGNGPGPGAGGDGSVQDPGGHRPITAIAHLRSRGGKPAARHWWGSDRRFDSARSPRRDGRECDRDVQDNARRTGWSGRHGKDQVRRSGRAVLRSAPIGRGRRRAAVRDADRGMRPGVRRRQAERQSPPSRLEIGAGRTPASARSRGPKAGDPARQHRVASHRDQDRLRLELGARTPNRRDPGAARVVPRRLGTTPGVGRSTRLRLPSSATRDRRRRGPGSLPGSRGFGLSRYARTRTRKSRGTIQAILLRETYLID